MTTTPAPREILFIHKSNFKIDEKTASGAVVFWLAYNKENMQKKGFRFEATFKALFFGSIDDRDAIEIHNITITNAVATNNIAAIGAEVDYIFGDKDLSLLMPALQKSIVEQMLESDIKTDLNQEAIDDVLQIDYSLGVVDSDNKVGIKSVPLLAISEKADRTSVMVRRERAGGYVGFDLHGNKQFSAEFTLNFDNKYEKACYLDGLLTSPKVDEITNITINDFDTYDFFDHATHSDVDIALTAEEDALAREMVIDLVKKRYKAKHLPNGSLCEFGFNAS